MTLVKWWYKRGDSFAGIVGFESPMAEAVPVLLIGLPRPLIISVR